MGAELKVAKNNFLSEEEILEVWGDGFREIANHPQIKFTVDTVQVTLRKTPPLQNMDSPEPTKVLTFEEPDVGTLKRMDSAKGDIGKIAELIQGATGLPKASAEKIKSSDFIVLSKLVACFLSPSQEIIGTSQET